MNFRPKIAFLNRSTVLTDDEAHRITDAVAKQAHDHWAPIWGSSPDITFIPSHKTTGWQGKWNILYLDTSDEANALGYHDLTPEGLPVGKVFAKTDQMYGAAVGVTTSHELLEMLLDPYINLTAFDTRRNVFVAYEACDAVERDDLGYAVNGVQVSDFVLPPFFDPTARGRKQAKFSYMGHVTAPFQLAGGGYESIFIPGKGWVQNTARRGGAAAADRPRVGSRRERRHRTWEASGAAGMGELGTGWQASAS